MVVRDVMRALSVVLSSLATLAPAAWAQDDAPYARDDIVDIRHDRYPRRDRVLGWTAEGAIAVRQTRCGHEDLSGAPSCDAVLVIAAAGEQAVISRLFHHVWDPEAAHTDVSYEQARDFIRAERAALGALPALTPGATHAGRAPVRLRVTDCRATLRATGRTIATVARTAGCSGSNDEFLRGGRIDRVETSPDDAHVAVFVTLEYVELDTYYDEAFVIVLAREQL